MKTWTIDEMMSHSPCPDYPRERLEELWAGRERLSVIDILDLEIPADDRVWAVLQAGEHVQTAIERIVVRAVADHCLSCGIPKVESWAHDWLLDHKYARNEKDARSAMAAARDALGAARVAALTSGVPWGSGDSEAVAAVAAVEAAGDAVLAAESAAEAAARMAADPTWAAADVAWSAVRAAEWTESKATRGAARAAERERQIEDIRSTVIILEYSDENLDN